MAESTKRARAFRPVQIKVALGTPEVLDNCIRLAGRDQYGKVIPGYAIIDHALRAYEQELKGANEHDQRNGTSEREILESEMAGQPRTAAEQIAWQCRKGQ